MARSWGCIVSAPTKPRGAPTSAVAAKKTPEEVREERVGRLSALLLGNALEGAALARPVAPPNLLVPRYGIAQGRPTALVAYGGVGKTWLAMDLALAVASGSADCWGQTDLIGDTGWNKRSNVLDRRTVLHLDFEMGAAFMAKRYQRMAVGRKIDLATLGDRLKVVSFPKANLATAGIDVALARACAGTSLCIIDSFRAAAPGVDENSSDARKYLDLLTRASDATGTAFVVLFHEGKQAPGGDRPQKYVMRGTSALFDAAGSALAVQVDGDDMIVTQTKASLGRSGSTFRVRLVDEGDMHTDWWLTEGIKVVAVGAEQQEKEKGVQSTKTRELAIERSMQSARLALATYGDLGMTQLIPKMVGAKDVRKEALDRLEASGAIVRPEGDVGTKRPFRLADPTKATLPAPGGSKQSLRHTEPSPTLP
jgi:hypothetical protein